MTTPGWKRTEIQTHEGGSIIIDVVAPELAWMTVYASGGDVAGAGLAPHVAVQVANTLRSASDAAHGWQPAPIPAPRRRSYTSEDLALAGARNDDLADRGVKPDQVARDHGFPDADKLSKTAFDRALRAYALATGQIRLEVGYQPTVVKPPRTDQQKSLWALLSGMWLDGFMTCLIMQDRKD